MISGYCSQRKRPYLAKPALNCIPCRNSGEPSDRFAARLGDMVEFHSDSLTHPDMMRADQSGSSLTVLNDNSETLHTVPFDGYAFLTDLTIGPVVLVQATQENGSVTNSLVDMASGERLDLGEGFSSSSVNRVPGKKSLTFFQNEEADVIAVDPEALAVIELPGLKEENVRSLFWSADESVLGYTLEDQQTRFVDRSGTVLSTADVGLLTSISPEGTHFATNSIDGDGVAFYSLDGGKVELSIDVVTGATTPVFENLPFTPIRDLNAFLGRRLPQTIAMRRSWSKLRGVKRSRFPLRAARSNSLR